MILRLLIFIFHTIQILFALTALGLTIYSRIKMVSDGVESILEGGNSPPSGSDSGILPTSPVTFFIATSGSTVFFAIISMVCQCILMGHRRAAAFVTLCLGSFDVLLWVGSSIWLGYKVEPSIFKQNAFCDIQVSGAAEEIASSVCTLGRTFLSGWVFGVASIVLSLLSPICAVIDLCTSSRKTKHGNHQSGRHHSGKHHSGSTDPKISPLDVGAALSNAV